MQSSGGIELSTVYSASPLAGYDTIAEFRGIQLGTVYTVLALAGYCTFSEFTGGLNWALFRVCLAASGLRYICRV